MSLTGPRAARADFGFVEPAAPLRERRLRDRAANLPRLIERTRRRLALQLKEARELGLNIREGAEA